MSKTIHLLVAVCYVAFAHASLEVLEKNHDFNELFLQRSLANIEDLYPEETTTTATTTNTTFTNTNTTAATATTTAAAAAAPTCPTHDQCETKAREIEFVDFKFEGLCESAIATIIGLTLLWYGVSYYYKNKGKQNASDLGDTGDTLQIDASGVGGGRGRGTTTELSWKQLGDDFTSGSVRRSSLSMMMEKANDAAETGEERPSWGSKTEFFLTTVGFAVGLGNVWRFPKSCMDNGGGSFLIPYLLALFILGLPLFCLELAVGQMFQKGSVELWKHIDPRLAGLGWGSIACVLVVALYYNIIITWTIYYFGMSFLRPLPWSKEARDWPAAVVESGDYAKAYWEDYALQSKGIWQEGWNEINWPMFLCLVLAWVVCFLCVRKGIESSGKVVYFTATFPYLVLIILVIRGVTLPGAELGIKFYLTPDFSKLGDIQVWTRACNQIFYSLGPGWASHIAHASFNPKDNNFIRDAISVSLINSATSIFAGFAVFSIAGYLAKEAGLDDVADLALGGPGLAFVAYPTAIAKLPGSCFMAIMFFVMLLTLGLDSQMGMVEALITTLVEAYPKLAKRREALVAVVCFCSCMAGIIFVTKGGNQMLDIFDYYVAVTTLFVVCGMEAVAVAWMYGTDKFAEDIEKATGQKISRYFTFSWKYTCPLFCFALCFVSLYGASVPCYLGACRPDWAYAIGWLCGLISLPVVPIMAIKNWRTPNTKTPGTQLAKVGEGTPYEDPMEI